MGKEEYVMADIVDFPGTENQSARHLERWVTEIIASHPDENVAKRWAAMAADTCAKFPNAPWPSQQNLPLDVLTPLDNETREAVLDAVQGFMQSYFTDVNNQLLLVHQELLTLQKQVAEQAEGYLKEET